MAEPFTIAALVISGLQAGSAIVSSQRQAQALNEQARYRGMILDANRRLAQSQTKDLFRAGEYEVSQIQMLRDRTLGSQRASLASQGVDMTSGSAASLLLETQMMSERDIQTARNNAWQRAWGVQVEAEMQGLQGQMMQAASRAQADATLLTGGLQALGYGMQGLAIAKGRA